MHPATAIAALTLTAGLALGQVVVGRGGNTALKTTSDSAVLVNLSNPTAPIPLWTNQGTLGLAADDENRCLVLTQVAPLFAWPYANMGFDIRPSRLGSMMTQFGTPFVPDGLAFDGTTLCPLRTSARGTPSTSSPTASSTTTPISPPSAAAAASSPTTVASTPPSPSAPPRPTAPAAKPPAATPCSSSPSPPPAAASTSTATATRAPTPTSRPSSPSSSAHHTPSSPDNISPRHKGRDNLAIEPDLHGPLDSPPPGDVPPRRSRPSRIQRDNAAQTGPGGASPSPSAPPRASASASGTPARSSAATTPPWTTSPSSPPLPPPHLRLGTLVGLCRRR
mgnify:CR=1 FL=1